MLVNVSNEDAMLNLNCFEIVMVRTIIDTSLRYNNIDIVTYSTEYNLVQPKSRQSYIRAAGTAIDFSTCVCDSVSVIDWSCALWLSIKYVLAIYSIYIT